MSPDVPVSVLTQYFPGAHQTPLVVTPPLMPMIHPNLTFFKMNLPLFAANLMPTRTKRETEPGHVVLTTSPN
jgi:hypothetical protein